MLKCRTLCLLLPCLVLLAGCASITGVSDSRSSGYRVLQHEQCVPYARRASGIPIYGDAWTWWGQAAGKYMRGAHPAPGAVLVLAKTSKLKHGHLAVVTRIIGPREIDVTHANWGDDWASRRIVYDAMRVQDISPANDWSSVRFWNPEHKVFGFPYAVQGFIYPQRLASY